MPRKMTRKPADPAARREVLRERIILDLISMLYVESGIPSRYSHHEKIVYPEARALLRSLRAWAKEEGKR